MKGFAHESQHNESKEWYTPKYIFDALGLSFDMDVCSPGEGVVPWIPAKRHLTIRENGLYSVWEGLVWMNPPYGSDTPKWMLRLKYHGNGVGLVFSRTDTAWFHDYAVFADCICFMSRRVQFIKQEQAAAYSNGETFKNSGSGAGSMLVAFGEVAAEAVYNCGLGSCFRRI